MIRNVSFDEISDGKLYGINDLVKADCNDCVGCSACCQKMGSSIQLDPLDVFNLTTNLNLTFEQLLIEKIELNVVDGIIMPNLKMGGELERCSFLNGEGRCSIHAFRPGICRLFPLGRLYEDHSFKYFLQVNECKKENKTKVKVKKWIDVPDLKKNEQFIIEWHYFLKDLQTKIKESEDAGWIKEINLYVINQFYLKPYDTYQDFYVQYHERMNSAKSQMRIA